MANHTEVVGHDMRFLLRFDSSPWQFRAAVVFILLVWTHSFKAPRGPTVQTRFKMSRIINLLEIPLPLEQSVPNIVEHQRLLNQVLISRSIGQEHAIQVIHVTVPQCGLVENEWTAPLLKYLSEVHSEAWNEAIARKRPDVPLFVLGQALPGACSLRDLLSRLANGIPSGSPIELNILTSEYSDEIRSAMDHGASKWSQLVNEVQCSLPPGQELRCQADAKADDVLRCLRRGFDTENIIFLGDSSFSSSSLRSNSSTLPLFEEVAVGGTFDHLHPGHTLLLTVAASLCRQEMTIGITSQQLLRGKKLHEHLLFDFDTRVGHVRSYLGNMFPSLKLDIHSLEDACGPAITKPQLQAIVVSSETLAGALKINEIRKERGMSSLAIVVVERRDAVILSSSFIRQQLHDRSVPN